MRILIVEDEFLVAMLLEDILSEMGHRVVARVSRVGEAIKIASEADINFAILDIDFLGGAKSFPVAEVLRRRCIPFLFATGYGSDGLAGEYSDELALQKRYARSELEAAIDQVSAGASG